MSSRTDPGVPTTSYISLYNTYKTQEKYENLTQNVYVLQLDRFRLQAPPISMLNFASDRLALLSERSEHWFMTKNMDICQQVSKKVVTIAWYFRYFVQTIVFFVMNQCSDHSESSATRSAAKFCIDIGGAFNLKRSSCKTYTFCVKFSYFPELGSFIEKLHHIYTSIYIYI